MWGYYWGYTAAQIELMAIDQPIVVYHKDKNKNGGKKSKKDLNDRTYKENPLKVLEAEDRWLSLYGDKELKPIPIDLSSKKSQNKNT